MNPPDTANIPVNPISPEDQKELDLRFTYHAPTPAAAQAYPVLRAKAKEFAELIYRLCPNSRERSHALTELDSVVFFANSSIARRG